MSDQFPVPPPGYTARPPRRDDAPEVAALLAACEVADGDPVRANTEDLLTDWAEIDLTEQALVVTGPNGRIDASVDMMPGGGVLGSVYGYVHPDWRGRGLGTFLVAWGEARMRSWMHLAPERVRVELKHYIRATNGSARHLLEACGYHIVRTVYLMELTLDKPPPSARWPEGIEVRTFVPGQDDRAVYEAGEDAFQDLWGRVPGTLESWMHPTRAEDFDPSLWFLAVERASGEVAGLCLCRPVAAGYGWVRSLGVRPPWRKRGLGLALLHHAFAEYRRRGVQRVGLSVDSESPTHAPRLYERAGMTVKQSYLQYRKALRSGED